VSATAGYAAKFYVTSASATAPAAGNQALSALSVSLSRSRTELDASYLGSAEKALILGQKQGEVSLSADYDAADPAIVNLEAAYDAGSSVWLHCHWNGTTGTKREYKVPSMQVEASADGKVGFSCTLKSCAAASSSP
jgi:hypothetical protein